VGNEIGARDLIARQRLAPIPERAERNLKAGRGGSSSLRVRRALLFYALRRLGLDVAADVRPASEQHIVLVNRAEVEAARVRAPQA
jgi:hypothetical protein